MSINREDNIKRNQERVWTPEMRAKVAASVSKYAKENPASRELREKRGAANRGRIFSEEHRKRIGDARRGKPRPDLANNRPTGQYLAHRWLQLTQDERDKHVSKILRGSGKHPNKLEKWFIEFLEQILPGKYKYTGNGSLIIGGKCPDFLYGNKIIEIFGNYWHKLEEASLRIEHFREYGFQTLIIWESEVSQEDIGLRIISFTQS